MPMRVGKDITFKHSAKQVMKIKEKVNQDQSWHLEEIIITDADEPLWRELVD
jgi:hypothetical protein